MTNLKNTVESHMQKIYAVGPRPIGSKNIRDTEAYIKRVFEESNLAVEIQEFDCLLWDFQTARLVVGGEKLPSIPNTFASSCDIAAPAIAASNLTELEQSNLEGKIAVLYGKLTAEPLVPKNFKFWNPEEHQKIIRLLETKKPEAVITISPKVYNPVPIIEDWDFKIPSVTVSAKTGLSLLRDLSRQVGLQITSTLAQSASANIIGRTNHPAKKRVVICAHYDTKYGTVGAFDNTSGTAALLAIAQSIAQKDTPVNLELVAFAGEEIYGLGELAYLDKYETEFENILAAINIDGVGLYLSANSIAFFEWPKELLEAASDLKARYPAMVQVDPWPQGDHTLFWPRQVPSIALSADLGSKEVIDLIQTISHTPEDTIEWVSPKKIAEVVRFVLELVDTITESAPEAGKG